jgi:hypothetical protein
MFLAKRADQEQPQAGIEGTGESPRLARQRQKHKNSSSQIWEYEQGRLDGNRCL